MAGLRVMVRKRRGLDSMLLTLGNEPWFLNQKDASFASRLCGFTGPLQAVLVERSGMRWVGMNVSGHPLRLAKGWG
jgi:hypothetical protein